MFKLECSTSLEETKDRGYVAEPYYRFIFEQRKMIQLRRPSTEQDRVAQAKPKTTQNTHKTNQIANLKPLNQ